MKRQEKQPMGSPDHADVVAGLNAHTSTARTGQVRWNGRFDAHNLPHYFSVRSRNHFVIAAGTVLRVLPLTYMPMCPTSTCSAS